MKAIQLTVNENQLQDIFKSADPFFKAFDEAIELIEKNVSEDLKSYTVENIMENEDEAKNARAELNNGSKRINDARLALEKQWNAPFQIRKDKLNAVKKCVDEASKKIDTIIKEGEELEKQKKKLKIEEMWSARGFDIIELSQIFDTRWLNKTTKIKDIGTELDSCIDQVKKDIALLEKFPDDVIQIKSFYLQCLDISKAIEEADRLKVAREKAEKEAQEREEIAKAKELQEQSKELYKEEKQLEKQSVAESLASQALGNEESKPVLHTFTLRFTCTLEQGHAIRKMFNDAGVTYEKLEN